MNFILLQFVITISLLHLSLSLKPNPSQESGIYCNIFKGCGSYLLTCYQNECLCNIGFTWNGTLRKCEQQHCDVDSDCSTVFPNTQCFMHGCECLYPYASLDAESQSCQYDPIQSFVIWALYLVFGFVMLILVLACCLGALGKRRGIVPHAIPLRGPSGQSAPQVVINVSTRGSDYGSINQDSSHRFGHYIPPPPHK